jgi:DNA invertase Pin-like site-specific DNA recombinase
MTDKPLIAYIRVSTSQQARSGLGIEAQRESLKHFANAQAFVIIQDTS